MNFEILALIGINFLLTKKGFDDPMFMHKYRFNVGAIQNGDKFRMLSSGFLHVDWNHFIFNMLTLYFFGPFVMAYLGKVPFLLIYLFCLLFGNFIALKAHRNQKNYSAVGASGAIMGIIYSSILLAPENKIYVFFLIGMPSYVFGLIYLLYSIYGLKKQNDGIGHAAHIGGAIGGFISMLVLSFHSIVDHYWVAILMFIPIIYVAFLIKNNKI